MNTCTYSERNTISDGDARSAGATTGTASPIADRPLRTGSRAGAVPGVFDRARGTYMDNITTRLVARLLPDARLHVYPDGHLGLLTMADDLAALVSAFLG